MLVARARLAGHGTTLFNQNPNLCNDDSSNNLSFDNSDSAGGPSRWQLEKNAQIALHSLSLTCEERPGRLLFILTDNHAECPQRALPVSMASVVHKARSGTLANFQEQAVL